MEGNFVSDISDALLYHYNRKEFEQIYDIIDTNIKDLNENNGSSTDSIFRLQQDISFLNTALLNSISKYVNAKPEHRLNSETNSKKNNTFKEQSKSLEVNLVYKYIYLIIKTIVIFALFTLVYEKLISNNSKNSTLYSQKINNIS